MDVAHHLCLATVRVKNTLLHEFRVLARSVQFSLRVQLNLNRFCLFEASKDINKLLQILCCGRLVQADADYITVYWA